DRRPYTRAASSQKCIRISGKHNDLENVGVTARHHTFFEMLGNFSFGDYFKEESIVYAWELLTKVLGVPEKRLIITVFEGAEGFAADDEAAALWKRVTGFGDDRIRRLGMADNFWSMGATGPCGPCSEIHYFHGDDPDLGSFGEEPGTNGRGWMEIWNLVFMQYDRAREGADAVPLPAPSIDTGAGLERLASVVQGVSSNYDTDLLRRLIARTEDIARKRYTRGPGEDDVSMRVIADHARTAAFLIAEGIFPDRDGREYVLRRVMRRAIRHGHRLGIGEPFLHLVAREAAEAMGDAYPELHERAELIASVTEREETSFRATIERGLELIAKNREWTERDGKRTMPGAVAFKLYDTFGFPLDLTQVIGREQGFEVDADGYERELEAQRARSEGSKVGSGALDSLVLQVASRAGKTTFSGYEAESDTAELLAILKLTTDGGTVTRSAVDAASEGDEVELVFPTTPFYAEAGGQVGDAGTVQGSGFDVAIVDTQKPSGDTHLHRGRVTRGTVRVGERAKLIVDHERRSATRRNHSATHLLHWALREVLGPHAQQKGSLVGSDVLRFDFAHHQSLTSEEVTRLEDLVNGKILGAAPVHTEVLGIAEARKKGAMAIFEEKYGDVVRVLTMTSDSVELCGGTHCRSLGEIGLFKIVSEAGTAAGVRRILAVTGTNAVAHLRKVEDELRRARAAAKATGGADLAERIEKMSAHERQLEKRVKELEKQLLEGGSGGGGLDAMLGKAQHVGDVHVLGVRVADGTDMAALRELAEKLRDKLGARAVVLGAARSGDKAQLVLTVSKEATSRLKAGALIRPIAEKVGGSGGGRPDMAQAGGTNPAGLDEAVAALRGVVEGALA
ncbi:MAG: alanine--tRNA ligase, partial [Deltaproteobacteria bacterium]|nr:alanine--tRNA ligase [Deltaproteobacteria bacterium]